MLCVVDCLFGLFVWLIVGLFGCVFCVFVCLFAWLGFDWIGFVSFGLVWFGLVWFVLCLVWFGVVFGVVCSVLFGWFGFVCVIGWFV